MTSLSWAGGFVLSVILGFFAFPAAAEKERAVQVDVALVLAIDASASVDPARWKLQMEGYVQAFRSQEVVDAIRRGRMRKIAVTLVHWSSVNEQKQVVNWTIIQDGETSMLFADAIAKSERAYGGATSISGAIRYGTSVLKNPHIDADRRIIDISGDGENNNGDPPHEMRDAAVREGIVINGLAIIADDPSIADYYRDHVIGGEGSFLRVAINYADFARAIRLKLITEISTR